MFWQQHMLNFSCLGSDCPMHCCGGWQIPVSEATYQKLIQRNSAFGKNFRVAEKGWRMKQESGRCLAMNECNLCTIQLQFGHESIPKTCASYPRAMYRWNGENPRTEVGGFLSCPEVARQILTGEAGDLIESPREHRVNMAAEFETQGPYHDQFLYVRQEIVQHLDRVGLDGFLCALANAVARSPAFFNQSSKEDQSARIIDALKVERLEAMLYPSATMIKTHYLNLQRLLSEPPEMNYLQALDMLSEATQWVESNGIDKWIEADKELMTQPEIRAQSIALWRYEWMSHPYLTYPNLFLYCFDFQLRWLLFRLFRIVNTEQSSAIALASVERLTRHSPWLQVLQQKMLSQAVSITPLLLSFSPWIEPEK